MKTFFYHGYFRNYHSLCRELAIDHTSDRKENEARIIREGYQRWGHLLGNHLYGHFSIALFDEQKQEIFCTRDPFGRDALYYSITEEGNFICADKLSDILTAEGFEKKLNTDVIEPYLELGYLQGEMTFFQNVKMLPPAHYLFWDGNKVITGCYTEEKAVTEKSEITEERTERIRHTLQEISSEDAEVFSDCFRMEQIETGISAEDFFYALPWVMRFFDQPQTDPNMAAYMVGLRAPARSVSHFSCLTGLTAFCSAAQEYPDPKLVRDFHSISQIADAYNVEILTPFCDARLIDLAGQVTLEDIDFPDSEKGTGEHGFHIPIENWMRTGTVKTEIKSRLSGSIAQRFLGMEKTENLWRRFISGDDSPGLIIYRIYVFILWYEEHFCSESKKWMVTTKSTADAVLVQEYETGEVLYAKNAEKRLPIASITKLAAALAAARHIPDPENTYIPVKQEIIDSLRDPTAAFAGFQNHVGRRVSCMDLLCGSLISSGCEAVAILADAVSGGNRQNFIAEMNDAAREAGCQNTLFYDSCGLIQQSRSTAADIALILKAVFEIPFLQRILSTSFYRLQLSGGTLKTTNEMINPKDSVSGFCPYCVGGKTGTASFAGANIGALFERNGKKYISVVLNEDYTRHPSGTKMVFYMCKEAVYRVFESTGHFIQISLPEHYRMLSVGSIYRLMPEVIRNTGDDPVQYTFFSSDESIAAVDAEGVVTIKGEGIVQISVMTQTGDYDYCFLNSTSQTEVTLRCSGDSIH